MMLLIDMTPLSAATLCLRDCKKKCYADNHWERCRSENVSSILGIARNADDFLLGWGPDQRNERQVVFVVDVNESMYQFRRGFLHRAHHALVPGFRAQPGDKLTLQAFVVGTYWTYAKWYA